MRHTSEVTLNHHYYPPALIHKGLASFPIKPATRSNLPDGSTHLLFICERARIAQDFANHLLTITRNNPSRA